MDAASSAIIGLGNTMLSDDGVGPVVARRIHEALNDPDLAFHELAVGEIELIEIMAGYEKVVIIDAIQTEGGRVGDWYLVDPAGGLEPRHMGMTHRIGLQDGLAFGRRIGLKMPQTLRVYAIEVADPFTFGTEMTPAVLAAIPGAVKGILAEEYGHKIG